SEGKNWPRSRYYYALGLEDSAKISAADFVFEEKVKVALREWTNPNASPIDVIDLFFESPLLPTKEEMKRLDALIKYIFPSTPIEPQQQFTKLRTKFLAIKTAIKKRLESGLPMRAQNPGSGKLREEPFYVGNNRNVN